MSTVLNRIGTLFVDEYQQTLVKARKVATRKTIISIDYELTITSTFVKVTITADKSLLFIEKGRRKGAKRPVKKVGDKFELVEPLQEWVRAVGYTGSEYLLAKGISERGIEPTKITEIVVERIDKELRELLNEYAAEKMTAYLDARLSEIFVRAVA